MNLLLAIALFALAAIYFLSVFTSWAIRRNGQALFSALATGILVASGVILLVSA